MHSLILPKNLWQIHFAKQYKCLVYEINVTLILAVGKMEKEAEITQKKLFMELQSWWSCGQECLPLAFLEG